MCLTNQMGFSPAKARTRHYEQWRDRVRVKRRERARRLPWDIACIHACHERHTHYGLVWRRNDFNESWRKLIQKKTKQTISTQQNCFLIFTWFGGSQTGINFLTMANKKVFFSPPPTFLRSLFLSLLLFRSFPHALNSTRANKIYYTARTHRSPIAK